MVPRTVLSIRWFTSSSSTAAEEMAHGCPPLPSPQAPLWHSCSLLSSTAAQLTLLVSDVPPQPAVQQANNFSPCFLQMISSTATVSASVLMLVVSKTGKDRQRTTFEILMHRTYIEVYFRTSKHIFPSLLSTSPSYTSWPNALLLPFMLQFIWWQTRLKQNIMRYEEN